MVTRLFLHIMTIVSLWLMYSSDDTTEFIFSMFFWGFYMRKLYVYETTGGV